MFEGRRGPARILAVVLALATGLALAACSNDGGGDRERAQQLLEQGLQAHAGGDLATAEDAYLQVIVLDPQNKFAYYNLGVIAHGRGETSNAEDNYRTTLRIDPGFAPALFNLAILRTSLGDGEEAVELYERLIQVEPANAAAHLNLGFLLVEQGFERRGQRELDEAVRIDPSLEGRIEPEGTGETPVAEAPAS